MVSLSAIETLRCTPTLKNAVLDQYSLKPHVSYTPLGLKEVEKLARHGKGWTKIKCKQNPRI